MANNYEEKNTDLTEDEISVEETSAEDTAAQEVSAEETSAADETDESSDGKKKKKEKINKEPKDPVKAAAKEQKKQEKNRRRALKARAYKKGWFSVALVAFFIVAVVVLNMIVGTLGDKLSFMSFDMTADDSFTLTDDTLELLDSLEEDFTIYVLADEDDYSGSDEYFLQGNTLFHEYANNSDHITLEYVDLSENPTFNTTYYPDEELQSYNVIVQGEDDYRYIEETEMYTYDSSYYYYYGYYVINGSDVESCITTAILNLTLKDKPVVTFISDITGQAEDYSSFMSLLENNGFETQEVSAALGTIPEETEVLVLFAPSSDLDSDFVDAISNWLTNDGQYGKQLLYLPSYNATGLDNIDSLIEEWGIAVEDGYAYETDANYYTSQGLINLQYADTTYQEYMSNTSLPYTVYYAATRTLDVLDEDSVTTLLTLTESGQTIYFGDSAETSDEASSGYEYVDTPNAVIAAVATKSTTVSTDDTDTDTDTDSSSTETLESNIVVIGSAYSLSSSFLERSTSSNSSYMVSMLNVLTNRDGASITIETKTMEGEELGITTAQIRVLSIIFVAVVPIIFVIAGIVIFVKRRHL
ncbi:MAG: GldG family protein [Bacteroides sp.]|nr:GldG family protein [Bacteroides sp.]